MVDFMKECIEKHGFLVTLGTFAFFTLLIILVILAWNLPELIEALK